MTPKEKSKELLLKFLVFTDSADEYRFAVECALIAVNELLDNTSFEFYNLQTSELLEIKYNDFWKEVKEELEKL
jgi:hypothetical protein